MVTLNKYWLINSSKGIILSYKPLVKTDSILVYGDEILLAGNYKYLEKIGREIGAKEIFIEETILPGFVDPHLHIDSLGFELETISLINTMNRDELLDNLRAVEPNIGNWIIGGRFDHLVFPDKKPPTRKDLDKVSTEYPVLLIHRSGHMGVTNTKGLETIGKWFGRLENIDYENGYLYESTLWMIREKIFREVSRGRKYSLFKKAVEHVHEFGVTAIGVAGCDVECLDVLKEIDHRGELGVRTYVYLYIDKPEDLEWIVKEYIETHRRYSRLRVNGVKILLDGALGPRTAYLSKPYRDDPSNHGILLYEPGFFKKLVKTINSYGLQIAIHSIGDAALDLLLDTYREIKEYVKIYRHRIEHASIIRDDQLEIIREVKPVIVVQPHFIITDKWILDRIEVERVKQVYRFKSLHRSTYLAFSTDAPVEPVNPWETIYAAITRGIYEGLEHGKLTLDERLDILETLYIYTRGSGYALRDDKLGCLLPGCYADMVVVDKDPLKISDPSELLSIKTKPLTPWMGKQ